MHLAKDCNHSVGVAHCPVGEAVSNDEEEGGEHCYLSNKEEGCKLGHVLDLDELRKYESPAKVDKGWRVTTGPVKAIDTCQSIVREQTAEAWKILHPGNLPSVPGERHQKGWKQRQLSPGEREEGIGDG